MKISKETIDFVLSFSEDRDWKQFHNPKDLALSLSLEASELLELFQWLSSDEAVKKNKEKSNYVNYSFIISIASSGFKDNLNTF